MKKLVLLAVMLFGFTAFAQTQEDAQKQAYKKAETLTATHVDRIVSMLEIKDDNTTQKIKEVLFEKNLILSQHPDLSEQRKVILKDKIEGVLNNVLDKNQLAKLKKDQDFYGQLLK